MLKQAEDFRDESSELAAVLEPLSDADFDTVTQFKGWTINDVLGHLHIFNHAASLSLQNDQAFRAFFQPLLAALRSKNSILDVQRDWIGHQSGRALRDAWALGADVLADAYTDAEPKRRIQWAGQTMSALSSVTARQMETWAHGKDVFDILGQKKVESDRVKNIVYLGVNTYGWAFINRNMEVPKPTPFVDLIAPSGVRWTWGAGQDDNHVTGLAVEFAQVVTQTRNVADTTLQVQGDNARAWMQIAQCFAGLPEDPPEPGTRFRVSD